MDNRAPDDMIEGTNLTERKAKSFEDELSSLLNRHSMENASDTADFILAEYMTNCLIHFGLAVQAREKWFGRTENPIGGNATVPVSPSL